MREIEAGNEKWGCESKQDLDRRCERLDEIFQDIKRNGYKSRKLLRELEANSGGPYGPWEDQDEITVNVGRHGDLIFNNGRHRLTFAKIAGVQKVPVRITVRHALWESFKKEIMQYALGNGGLVYSPITHIDLQHVPAMYADVRWDLIKSNLGKGNSTVLDIGAHWGYFCHKFEEEGFRCFAVEVDHRNVYFLHKLMRAANREFTVIPKSIFDLRREGPLKYDIVLALAVFHHFIKEERAFGKLKDLLPRLDMNEMYFEPHLYDEPEMRDAFMNFTPEEFVHFILQNSCLNNYRLLGKCERGKPVFKLWRE
ncbi:MAG: class I SAM-dependent methyltransferase [Candidatus Bathyarchaeota archaeon]|nr:class I SAM-dependent methyltransferase [Candidatus Bathyarchaeota archaeon]